MYYYSEARDNDHVQELIKWKEQTESLRHQLVKQKELAAKLRRSNLAQVLYSLFSLVLLCYTVYNIGVVVVVVVVVVAVVVVVVVVAVSVLVLVIAIY